MLWIKAFHIITIICWFAGIFYLPRLFVYHAMAEDQKTKDHLKVMERKLYRFVTPFMVLTVLLGIYLMSANWEYFLNATWFQIKVACVVLLVTYHFYCGKLVQDFADDKNQRNDRFYRVFNELPVLLLFTIVIMVIVRPF